MSLGQRLKELRKIQNLSRRCLASAVGLSYWALSKYENDEREPDYQTLISLADYFQVPMDYLLERKLLPESDYIVDLSGLPGAIREEILNYIEYKKANSKKK